MLTTDEAITGIRKGKWQFYVGTGNAAVRVVVAERNGRQYLKTEADSTETNNLLSLPNCP